MGKCMRNFPIGHSIWLFIQKLPKLFFHKLGFLKRLEISFFCWKVIFFKAFKMIFHLGQCPKGPTNNIGKKGLFPF